MSTDFQEESIMKKTKITALILTAVIIIALLVLGITATSTVPSGHTGIVVTFGRVEDYVLNEGLHFKLPWQQIIIMDNRNQKAQLNFQAFSSDIQQVNVKCSVNYSINKETSQNLYKNIGVAYYDTVVEPRIIENVKAIIAKYTAENLIKSRDSLSGQTKDILSPEMNTYGINILSVAIEDIDFTDVFTNAVEAKQVAEQSKLQATIEQEQKNMEQEAEAKRKVIAAEAEAAVAKIQADADAYAVEVQAKAEAEVNQKLAASLTELLVKYNETMQWNGELPQIVGSDSVLPVLDIEDTQKAENK
jgi:regulator of protease activity HflC (stomatin/prohibitin superfamily)